MDPFTNIKRQRELAASINMIRDECAEDGTWFSVDQLNSLADLALELAELVEALDGWRLGGGFDPYRAVA